MGTKIICIGMACVDIIIRDIDLSVPFTSETKMAGEMVCGVGGDASNQAIVLAKMGADVEIITGIGDDGLGAYIMTEFERAGVNTDHISVAHNVPSCMNVVIIHPSGQRNFINAGMPESIYFQIDPSFLSEAKIISLGSILVPPFVTQDSIMQVAKRAKEKGALVCADVVCSPEKVDLEDIKEVLPYIDYIFPNEEEASILTGKTDRNEMAETLLGYGIKNVVLKTGKEGCIVYSQNFRFVSPAFHCEVVDTNGAGDNFAAGFILALSEDRSLEECCRMAAATAAVSIQSVGANTGVKNRDQVERLLREQE